MKARIKERMFRSILPAMAAVLLVPLPNGAQAQSRSDGWQASPQRVALQREIEDRVGKELRPFYAARQFRPLWLNEFGRPSGAASMLMHRLRTSEFDDINPKKLGFKKIARLVDRARRGDRDDI